MKVATICRSGVKLMEQLNAHVRSPTADFDTVKQALPQFSEGLRQTASPIRPDSQGHGLCSE
jgi:hypothetical protein